MGPPSPIQVIRRVSLDHLIDVANPDETWSLAVFQQAAAQAIADIHGRQKLPILVGGTGQYLRAIVEGWSPPNLPPQPRLRAALEAWAAELGPQALHDRLAVLDPTAAAAIEPRNVRRTQRALEVTFTSGRRFSEQRQKRTSPYRVLQIGLSCPRPVLYERIDARIQSMLDAGWVDEVKALLAKGYEPGLPSLSAIGYAQIIKFVRGELPMAEAITDIKRKTRTFVRRQAAWFRSSDPNIHWFEAGDPLVADKIEMLIRTSLS